MEFSRTLPFPRGSTYSDKSLVSTATDSGSSFPGMQYAGQIYTVPDTVHKKHPFVRLRVVHNHTTALTVARKIVEFTTAAGESGRYVTALTNAAGDIGKPFDDAYTSGLVIAKNDMFYVVDEGPCDVLTTSSQTLANNMGIGWVVTPGDGGLLYSTAAAAGNYRLGVMDEEPMTASTAYRVYVKSGVMKEEG